MNTNQLSQQQAHLLDVAYRAVPDNKGVQAAPGLDPGLAAAADSAATRSGEPAHPRVFRFGVSIWRIAAMIVLMAATGACVVPLRLQPASTQEIVRHAQASLVSPLGAGVQSYFLTEQTTVWVHNGIPDRINEQPPIESRSEVKHWFQAPANWRVESAGEIYADGGQPLVGSSWKSVLVSDGSTQYAYDALANVQTVNLASEAPADPSMLAPASDDAMHAVSNLAQFFERMATCYRPRVTGSAEVAGQPTHVVDLGSTLCPSAAASDLNGHETIWVDKNTFFVLKHELYSTEGNQLLLRSEVTDVQYNRAVDSRLFVSPAPSDAQILDYRPQALPPAPTQEGVADPQQAALLAALQPLAEQAAYPLFVPEHVPAGLSPRMPKLMPWGDNSDQLVVEWVPTGDLAGDTYAGQAGIQMRQQAADYASVVNFTRDATPVHMSGAGIGANIESWARRGMVNADGTGSDSSFIILRDGVLITLSSFAFSPEQLLGVAATLQSVPGSKGALPRPQPPTLAQVRAGAPFPIYVPTWVPAGLAPEPPVGYEITYHDRTGQPVFTITNGASFANDPRAAGERVTLGNGVDAHWLGSLLWWMQEGDTSIALYSDSLSREELIQIAASVSANAEPEFAPQPHTDTYADAHATLCRTAPQLVARGHDGSRAGRRQRREYGVCPRSGQQPRRANIGADAGYGRR